MTPKGIVIHVSASTWGDSTEIARWHKQRGWRDIGYHYVITNGFLSSKSRYVPTDDGIVQHGRSENDRGAHCVAGGMNDVSLGVCLIGNPGWTPAGPDYMPHGPLWRTAVRPYLTRRQYDTLIDLLSRLCRKHGLDPKGTFDHRGRKVHVLSQHSDHDDLKPLCASLNMGLVRNAVAKAMAS